MKAYLKSLLNHAAYETFATSNDFITPNVSFDLDHVHYNSLRDYSKEYLTFEAIESGTFKFTQNALQYSIDNGQTWTSLAANTDSPTIQAGNKILWKQTGLMPNSNGLGQFASTANFKTYGNIMSLYYGDNFIGQTDLSGKISPFKQLFSSAINLIDASNLILPETTSASDYSYMFYNCTSLIAPPKLSTILSPRCYEGMFMNCTALTTAPELPATILPWECYQYMFRGCTSLNYIKCLATDITASDCTTSWVDGVAITGTFIKAASTDWSSKTGNNGIPSGWTVQNV